MNNPFFRDDSYIFIDDSRQDFNKYPRNTNGKKKQLSYLFTEFITSYIDVTFFLNQLLLHYKDDGEDCESNCLDLKVV